MTVGLWKSIMGKVKETNSAFQASGLIKPLKSLFSHLRHHARTPLMSTVPRSTRTSFFPRISHSLPCVCYIASMHSTRKNAIMTFVIDLCIYAFLVFGGMRSWAFTAIARSGHSESCNPVGIFGEKLSYKYKSTV